jgi:hypothetical protein
MSEFEIELVSLSVIGAAIDAENALNVMDEAMRKYPTDHIQIPCGTMIHAKRVGLYRSHCRNGRLSVPKIRITPASAVVSNGNWRRQPFLEAL